MMQHTYKGYTIQLHQLGHGRWRAEIWRNQDKIHEQTDFLDSWSALQYCEGWIDNQ
jgi:hypothetical protein